MGTAPGHFTAIFSYEAEDRLLETTALGKPGSWFVSTVTFLLLGKNCIRGPVGMILPESTDHEQ